MNPKQFKAAIRRQCGFEPLDGDDLDELYAEEQARQYEHTLFSKAANNAFEHAPIKLATASPSEGGQTEVEI